MPIPSKASLLTLSHVKDGAPFFVVTGKPSIDTLALDYVKDGEPTIAAFDAGSLVPRSGGSGQTKVGGFVSLPGTEGSIITIRPWSLYKNFIFPSTLRGGGLGRWTIRWWMRLPGRNPGPVITIESGTTFVVGTVDNEGNLLVVAGDGVGEVEATIPDIPSGWTAVTMTHDPATEELIVVGWGIAVTIDTGSLTIPGSETELTFEIGPIEGGFTGITIIDEVMTPDEINIFDGLGPEADISGYIDAEGYYIEPIQPAIPAEDNVPKSLIPNSGSEEDEPLFVIGEGKYELFGEEVVAIILDSSQFVGIYQELLPPGPIWETDDDPKLRLLMEALSQEGARIYAQSNKIIVEGNPLTTVELVPEWEVVFDLPDDCAPPPETLAARQAAIAAAFLASGGQTVGYYLDLLELIFGVHAVIEENWPSLPFVTGDGTDGSGSEIGDALGSIADGLTWRVTMLGSEVLTQENADRIECLLNRIKPSHTNVVFNYVGSDSLYPDVDIVYVTDGLGDMTGTSPLGTGPSAFGVWLWVTEAGEGEVAVQVGTNALRVSASGPEHCIITLDYGYDNTMLVTKNAWHWCLLTHSNGTVGFYLDNELWSVRSGASLAGDVTIFGGGEMPYKAANIFGAARELLWHERGDLYSAGRTHDMRNATGMSWVGENVVLQWLDADSGGVVSNVGTGGTHNLTLNGDVTSEET